MMSNPEFYSLKKGYLATIGLNRQAWQEGYDRLVAEGRTLSPTSPEDYRRDLDDLRLSWERIDAAYHDLEVAEADTWEDARQRWNTTAETYRQHYLRTADRYWPAAGRPTWLADHTSHLIKESEGWVEGMGHQVDDSAGWTEGYEEVND